MVTGFEIFGAIGTCVALLNLARQGYESLAKTYSGYRKAGPHILITQRHCSQIYFNVQAWTTIWGFDIPMTDELYKAYWGEDGWNQIEYQLATVSIKCTDLAAIISKVLLSSETYQKIPEADSNRVRAKLDQRLPDQHLPDLRLPDQRLPLAKRMLRDRMRQAMYPNIPKFIKYKKVQEIRHLEEHITRSTSAWKKVKYVLCSCEKLQGHLQALQDDFERLKQLVETAWQLQHPDVDFKTSTWNEKRTAALIQSNLFLIQEAKKDRVATKELYSCCSGTRRAIKLEMSLLDQNGDSRSKCFHIFVPQTQYHGHLEVSTAMLRDDPPSSELQSRNDFLGACDSVHEEEQCLLSLPNSQNRSVSLREPRGRLWFRLRKRAMHIGILDLPSLRDQVDHLVAAERLVLAYSIVETGLLFLGTSWLSALSNVSLKRFKADDKAPRYILDINERGNLVRTQLADKTRDLHLYIFTIGVTLTEIALRCMIRDLRRSDSGFELSVAGPGGLKWRSLSHVVSLVKDALGIAYSEAVEFCLQDPVHAPNRRWKNGVIYDTTRSEEQISLELLELFYEKVLIKLDPYNLLRRREIDSADVFIRIALARSIPSNTQRTLVSW